MQGAKRILVVEDERLVARELELRLSDLGYVVAGTVANAVDAIALASRHVPDLVLMDIRIEGESDGIEAADDLRRRFDVPIIFLTAHSDDATLARVMATVPAGYLVKPLKAGELRSAVELALHKHEMSRQLREREHWFSTTLKSIGDAVISTDATGLVSFMNPVAEVLTGWRSEDARGRPLGEVFRLRKNPETSDNTNPITGSLEHGKIIELDRSILTRSGDERAIADSAAPIVDDHGNLLGGVLVFRDVTERHALQRQIEISDRLSSLGTMAAGVAHEVNNPLTYMLSNLDTTIEALQRLGLAELVADLEDVRMGAQRIRRIVSDLSVFGRSNAVGCEADVGACIHNAIRLASETLRGIDVTVEGAGGTVAIDERRLTQVLVNLLTNAAQAMTATSPIRRVAVSTSDAAAHVQIEVADTGRGMSPQVSAKIFDPFFTTRPIGEGTGLGLAICHGIVKSVGGAIEVESRTDAGTTFRIALPKAIPQAPEVPVITVRRGRILVVDDEPLLRSGIARTLGTDHDVVLAATGKDGIDRICCGERYDLILCDLMMPEVTGIDVFERMLEIDATQARRIIFVTGGAFSTRAAEFLAVTKNPVLEKPFSPHALRSLVASQLAALG